MRKRKIFLAFLFVGGLSLNIGCASSLEKELPQLIIGCDNYRPYNYTDEDGEAAGIDVELAKEACSRMGYEPVFAQIEWNERDELLASGEIDCIWSCYSMNEDEAYAWVGPYMYSRQVIVVLEDSPAYTMHDLDGKSIGVRSGSKAEDILLNDVDTEKPATKWIYSLNDVNELMIALRNNYVDAVAGYSATITELLTNMGIPYRFLDQDLERAELGIAFSKDSDEVLRNQLKETLEKMQQDGTTESILKSYGLRADKALGEKGT